jgi:hypothetical protein
MIGNLAKFSPSQLLEPINKLPDISDGELPST